MNLEDLSTAIALETNLVMKKNVPKKLEFLSPRCNIVDINNGRKRRSCVKLPTVGEEEGEQEEKKRRKTRERSQSQSHMKLRSHRNKVKHFTVDHSKEEDSPDAENNNETNKAGTETNVMGGENLSEDELDLRLELDEEELQALQEEEAK